MSFKVNDLAVSLPGQDVINLDPCTTLTMTGLCGVSLFGQAGAARRLAALKAQLRSAMTRA